MKTTLIDFESETFWGSIHGWDDHRKEQALDSIRETGAVVIDKQMRPWVFTKSGDSNQMWGVCMKEDEERFLALLITIRPGYPSRQGRDIYSLGLFIFHHSPVGTK